MARVRSAGVALQRMVWHFVSNVRIAAVVDQKECDFKTACGILVRIGASLYLATAWHVFQQWITWRDEGRETSILVNDAVLTSPHLVFGSKEREVALIRVGEDAVGENRRHVYEPGSRWPPRRVTVDDVVILCGFPGSLREAGTDGTLLFKDVSLVKPVTAAYDDYFTLDLRDGTWENLGRMVIDLTTQDLAGVSGAAVFAFDDLSFPLVGIVAEQPPFALPVLYVRTLAPLPASIDSYLQSYAAV